MKGGVVEKKSSILILANAEYVNNIKRTYANSLNHAN